MEFKGKVIILFKDRYGCVHFRKKPSKGKAPLEAYKNYLRSLEENESIDLIKSFVINHDSFNYIWSSYIWRKDLNNKISKHHQEYLNYLEENRKDIIFIGPYKAKDTKDLHLCRRGHEWRIQPLKIMTGEQCPKCKRRNKEPKKATYITNLLETSNIEFVKEVSLKSLGYEQDLRLDFVVCQNNYPLFAIELNGIQHYKILNKHFGGVEGARQRRIRDRNKRQHCWNIGLPVIDIPDSESEEQIKETIFYFLRLFELIELKIM